MRAVGTVVALALLLAGGASLPRQAEDATAGATSSLAAATTIAPPAESSASRRAEREVNVYANAASAELSKKVAGVRHLVYVPETETGWVSVIDPRRLVVVRRFPAGLLSHHVTPAWDLEDLYVNNTAGNTLTVIDPRRGTTRRTIRVEDPYNLYFTPDGRKAIVVAERYRRLDFRNPHSWRLIKSVSIPGRGVDHLDFTADGRYLLASNEWSGDVVRVDTWAMRVVARTYVGGLPVDVKLSPDGSVFYVANQGRHGVSLMSTGRRPRELAFLRTAAGAHGLCVSRDGGFLYVSNRLAGSISVISFARRRVVATWRVGGSPDMLQVSPDGRRLWASNRYHSSVSVVDTRTGRLVRSIRVGGGPHGLTYFPQPGRYSVGHNGVWR